VRQSMLFSATFSDEVRALAGTLLDSPVAVDVAPRNTASELVEHTVHLVPHERKRDVLSHLIRSRGWEQVLVFTRTKHGANRLAEKLGRDGITAAAIHGNKSQAARTRALGDFKSGAIPVLVATDIAARGLDISELPHVVNFELPNVPEDYVHRIGRTGRAGSNGSALSLVARDEVQLLRGIEKLIGRAIERAPLDGLTFEDVALHDAPEAPGAEREPARASQRRERRPATLAEPREHHRRERRRPQGSGAALLQPQAAQGRAEAPGTQSMSEAARHQALPQPPLFRPAPGQRRRG
jgi:ATP-dependent RNA helicase RhlE